MAILEIRIFVPPVEPSSDWAETVLGRIIRPLTVEHSVSLEWFWFSRYISPVGEGEDSGSCDISLIPEIFKQPIQADNLPFHRSIRFRFNIHDAEQEVFSEQLLALINQHGYAVSGQPQPYDYVQDTGGNRFLGNENRQPNRDIQRAELVTRLYQAISLIVLDALIVSENNRYRIESNDHNQNPRHSSFESMHHLFCNICQPPLTALVYRDSTDNRLHLGSRWCPLQSPPLNLLGELPLRY